MHQLKDGTANCPASCSFSATLVDNDTYFYGQAINQPDHPSFIKAMVKEVDDLFNNGVWQLRRRSELGHIFPSCSNDHCASPFSFVSSTELEVQEH